jgi:hypothetical protein
MHPYISRPAALLFSALIWLLFHALPVVTGLDSKVKEIAGFPQDLTSIVDSGVSLAKSVTWAIF